MLNKMWRALSSLRVLKSTPLDLRETPHPFDSDWYISNSLPRERLNLPERIMSPMFVRILKWLLAIIHLTSCRVQDFSRESWLRLANCVVDYYKQKVPSDKRNL